MKNVLIVGKKYILRIMGKVRAVSVRVYQGAGKFDLPKDRGKKVFASFHQQNRREKQKI